MGLYSASKHAVEGMSETMDHEVRQFGIRVALIEPAYTKSNFDVNSTDVTNPIAAYDNERGLVSSTIAKNIGTGPRAGRRDKRDSRHSARHLAYAPHPERQGLVVEQIATLYARGSR